METGEMGTKAGNQVVEAGIVKDSIPLKEIPSPLIDISRALRS